MMRAGPSKNVWTVVSPSDSARLTGHVAYHDFIFPIAALGTCPRPHRLDAMARLQRRARTKMHSAMRPKQNANELNKSNLRSLASEPLLRAARTRKYSCASRDTGRATTATSPQV